MQIRLWLNTEPLGLVKTTDSGATSSFIMVISLRSLPRAPTRRGRPVELSVVPGVPPLTTRPLCGSSACTTSLPSAVTDHWKVAVEVEIEAPPGPPVPSAPNSEPGWLTTWKAMSIVPVPFSWKVWVPDTMELEMLTVVTSGGGGGLGSFGSGGGGCGGMNGCRLELKPREPVMHTCVPVTA